MNARDASLQALKIAAPMDRSVTTAPNGALFDAARFFAAFFVVLAHARGLTLAGHAGRPYDGGPLAACFYFLSDFGRPAVIVFFVVSGYWIASSVDRRTEKRIWSWFSYGVDRLSRLWIVLLPALVVGGTLDVIGRFYVGAPDYFFAIQGPHYDVAQNLAPRIFVGNLFFLQTLACPTFGSNGVLWSLSNEFWYYIWYPALLKLSWSRPSSWLPGAVAATSIIAFPSLIPGFFCWLCGVGLYMAQTRFSWIDRLQGSKRQFASWTSLVAFLATLFAWRAHLLSGPLADLAISISCGMFFLLFDLAARRPSGPLALAARYGASSSYSLYAVHYPLLVFLVACFGPKYPVEFGAGSAAWVILLIAVAVGYGWAFSLLTERHTPFVRKWLSVPRTAAA